MSNFFNSLVAKSLPIVPKGIVHWTAKKYVAGASLQDAVNTVTALNSLGIQTTIDCLGEFVSKKEQALAATEMGHKILQAIQEKKLKSGLSVKLTSLGLDIDDEFCYQNLRGLIERAKTIGRFVRIDMENVPYTTRTLQIYKKIRQEGFENTGVVIQAYLKRSEEDIRSLASLQTSVRLCKGIYREDPSVALQDRKDIQDNYNKLLGVLFENNMIAAIATHDDVLLNYAREYIAKNSIDKSRYEFQMLLGVRENKRDELVREGHPLRVYVPFGEDWYGYCVRRLRENPDVAGNVIKAFLTGGD